MKAIRNWHCGAQARGVDADLETSAQRDLIAFLISVLRWHGGGGGRMVRCAVSFVLFLLKSCVLAARLFIKECHCVDLCVVSSPMYCVLVFLVALGTSTYSTYVYARRCWFLRYNQNVHTNSVAKAEAHDQKEVRAARRTREPAERRSARHVASQIPARAGRSEYGCPPYILTRHPWQLAVSLGGDSAE